jgi:gluconolactonase
MFAASVEVIETEFYARLPENLKIRNRETEYTRVQTLGLHKPDSGLEGPSFDREGTLYCVDTPWGRIFRIDPKGRFEVVAEYDGWPNGLKIHRDGRIFVADYKLGIVECNPSSGRITPIVEKYKLEGFKGCNDLVFASNGDLYFTDQGQTGLHDPTGRVFRLNPDGSLDCLLDNVPSPNGIVLDKTERRLYVGVTRANAVWRVPLLDRGVTKVGTYIQMSGGIGPDGMALDENGGLVVAHPGFGAAWWFDEIGRPKAMIKSCGGLMVTNVAFGGEGNQYIYMTEHDSASVMRARLPVAGHPLYSHQNG